MKIWVLADRRAELLEWLADCLPHVSYEAGDRAVIVDLVEAVDQVVFALRWF